jgi:hypothetical protein
MQAWANLVAFHVIDSAQFPVVTLGGARGAGPGYRRFNETQVSEVLREPERCLTAVFGDAPHPWEYAGWEAIIGSAWPVFDCVQDWPLMGVGGKAQVRLPRIAD